MSRRTSSRPSSPTCGPSSAAPSSGPVRSPGRLASDVAHEVAHRLLEHQLSEVREIEGIPFRTCQPDEEEQATAFGGTLLLPRPLLTAAAYTKGGALTRSPSGTTLPRRWPGIAMTPPALPGRSE
ncbi:ImmA/IrrE family metallo-endopeptidase [Amycolatopsis palatopharyngis]|uniref:ImmA/IrrE family metallo-endopeptidase n=1 Tax=Amycolatopsis palatopharyngis TaxID=187982 RepID=UPI000E24FBC2